MHEGVNPGDLEAQDAPRRISGVYPFSPQKEDIGQLGDPDGSARDPYSLAEKINQVPSSLRSRKEAIRRAARHKKTQSFYDEQNELIRNYLKPLIHHAQDARDDDEAHRAPIKIAVYASLAANIILCVLQIYGAVS